MENCYRNKRMRQQQSCHHMGNPLVLNTVISLNKWGPQTAYTEELWYTHLMRCVHLLPWNIYHNWGIISCTRKIHYAYVLENSSTWNLSQSGILIQDAGMLFSRVWILTCLSDAGFHPCWCAQTYDLSQAMWEHSAVQMCSGFLAHLMQNSAHMRMRQILHSPEAY